MTRRAGESPQAVTGFLGGPSRQAPVASATFALCSPPPYDDRLDHQSGLLTNPWLTYTVPHDCFWEASKGLAENSQRGGALIARLPFEGSMQGQIYALRIPPGAGVLRHAWGESIEI